MAVSAHPRLARIGNATTSAASAIHSFGHVALVRLPMVQNTTAATACWLAKNWMSDISALKMKTSAMPRRMMVSLEVPRLRLRP